MSSSILSEHVAIIATRADWAKIAQLLCNTDPFRKARKDNPETYDSIIRNATSDPQPLFDAIVVTCVDTQLRIEHNITPVIGKVKIMKSESVMRSAWEPRNEVTHTD